MAKTGAGGAKSHPLLKWGYPGPRFPAPCPLEEALGFGWCSRLLWKAGPGLPSSNFKFKIGKRWWAVKMPPVFRKKGAGRYPRATTTTKKNGQTSFRSAPCYRSGDLKRRAWIALEITRPMGFPIWSACAKFQKTFFPAITSPSEVCGLAAPFVSADGPLRHRQTYPPPPRPEQPPPGWILLLTACFPKTLKN